MDDNNITKANGKESKVNVNINVGEASSIFKNMAITWFKRSWIYVVIALMIILFIIFITFRNPSNPVIDNAQDNVQSNTIKIEQLNKDIAVLNKKLSELEKKEIEINNKIAEIFKTNTENGQVFNNNVHQITSSTTSTKDNIIYINNKYKK